MRVTVKRRGRIFGRVLVTVAGDLDAPVAGQLQAALARAIDDRRPELVIDLSGVTSLDSVSGSVLRSVARRVRACGGSFEVVGVRPGIDRSVWTDPRGSGPAVA